MSKTRGAMKEITCKCGCGRKRMVRVADWNRGWGRYFDKSCKATAQYRKQGRKRLDPADYFGPPEINFNV